MKILGTYTASLLLFIASLFILIEYFDSQRMQGVAGVLFVIAIFTNALAFFSKRQHKKHSS